MAECSNKGSTSSKGL